MRRAVGYSLFFDSMQLCPAGIRHKRTEGIRLTYNAQGCAAISTIGLPNSTACPCSATMCATTPVVGLRSGR